MLPGESPPSSADKEFEPGDTSFFTDSNAHVAPPWQRSDRCLRIKRIRMAGLRGDVLRLDFGHVVRLCVNLLVGNDHLTMATAGRRFRMSHQPDANPWGDFVPVVERHLAA